MLSKNKIKFVLSLHQKKYRQKYNKFIVEGTKLCTELLQLKTFKPTTIFASSTWLENERSSLPETEIIEVSENEMKKISALSTPSSVMLIFDLPSFEFDIQPDGYYVFLDQVRDPGNVGTIIRTADWFGMNGVLCSPDCVELYSPKVIQASMGSIFRVNTKTLTYQELDRLSGQIPIVVADMHGSELSEHAFGSSCIVVMGSEGSGVSQPVFEMKHKRLAISSDRSKGAESLNVAVAAAIFMEKMARTQKI